MQTTYSLLTDILDMGVNFGQSEFLTERNSELTYVRTALNKARQHASRTGIFNLVDNSFDSIIQLPTLSRQLIEQARENFASQLKNNSQYLNIYYLGVNLGQLEIIATLLNAGTAGANDFQYMEQTVIPRAQTSAVNSGSFSRVQELFRMLSNDNFLIRINSLSRRTLALRLALREQINDQIGFRAGAYKIKLTVSIGEPLVGYNPPRIGNTEEGDLSVRALVIKNNNLSIVIVSIDALLIYNTNLYRIKNQVATLIGVNQIVINASHTHSGPEFSAPDSALSVAQSIREEQIVTAIVTAAGSLSKAEIGIGWGNSNQGFNRVQRQPDGTTKTMLSACDDGFTDSRRAYYFQNHPLDPLDDSIGVIKLQDATDKTTIATLINYAMHAVIYGVSSTKISADYVGKFTKLVEDNIGGNCLFLQGAAGDIDPWCCTQDGSVGMLISDDVAKKLSDKTIDIINTINNFDNSPKKVFFDTQNVSLISISGIGSPSTGAIAEINFICLGDELVLATFPGEFFVQHGKYLKKNSPFKNTFFLGYTNHAIGYVPTSDIFKSGAYGTDASSGCYVKVGTGEYLVSKALEMLHARY